MDPNTFPTKGNLILAKNSLKLSRQGYELMDKKRNILIREMMNLINQAKDIQTQIDVTFRTAYAALQKANMEIGIAFVQQIAGTVPIENSIRIKTRSVMGTEIPLVESDESPSMPTYAYYGTSQALDEANDAVRRRSLEDANCAGMGTTLVAAYLQSDLHGFVLNVGDSRGYRIGASGIRQITRDHSLVAELVARG